MGLKNKFFLKIKNLTEIRKIVDQDDTRGALSQYRVSICHEGVENGSAE